MTDLRHLPVTVPAGASDLVTAGPRPFVTRVEYTAPDGSRVTWQARAHRKSQPGRRGRRGLTWWIGLLFVIGSTCFVLGPIPVYASAVGPRATATTFFVGSLFFTTAAYLSYLQVVRDAGHRWVGWAPRHLGFWATSIQLAGTLFFNATTFAALLDVPSGQYDAVVWQPDASGCAAPGHRWWSWRPGERDWHITSLNLWGSVFFGLSAVGAYMTTSGTLVDSAVANGGTFAGAVCFLVASLLMMPEGRQAPVPAVGTGAPA